MLHRGFWAALPRPIIGLSPMDGITDAAFRYITCRYGKPSLTMTEFTNVEGLARGAVTMLHAFLYDPELERPAVAQIYGVELESFYQVALMLCSLGYDGIDINMGCPANKVARRGSGAGLIRIPEHAKKVIRITQKACRDWSEGITLEGAGIRPKILTALAATRKRLGLRMPKRRLLPVSVKTRIGYDSVVAEEWMKHLLEAAPAAISVHGRTLKQLYTGEANWEALGRAARVVRASGLPITFLGNGDIASLEDALRKIETYGVDGVLVGRAACGAPWVFTGKTPPLRTRVQIAIKHCEIFEKMMPERAFFNMRKHLAWYLKGFDGARELRVRLMQTNNSMEVKAILSRLSH